MEQKDFIQSFDDAVSDDIRENEVGNWEDAGVTPYMDLMAYYECALMEVETKFRVLNKELSLKYDGNPIESIKSRLKSPSSIADKLKRYGLPRTIKSIEDEINDVAGIRVICSFPEEIYELADALLKQDDVTLIRKKDYIKNPKPNGYSSLHLIIGIPIFLHDKKKMMRVEVQLRTLAMDLWASLEQKIRYKKTDISHSALTHKELKDCAKLAAQLDERMEVIHKTCQKIKS